MPKRPGSLETLQIALELIRRFPRGELLRLLQLESSFRKQALSATSAPSSGNWKRSQAISI